MYHRTVTHVKVLHSYLDNMQRCYQFASYDVDVTPIIAPQPRVLAAAEFGLVIFVKYSQAFRRKIPEDYNKGLSVPI